MSELQGKIAKYMQRKLAYTDLDDWAVEAAAAEVIETVHNDLIAKAIEASDAYAEQDNDEMSDLWWDRVGWLELSKARALAEPTTGEPAERGA